MQIFVTKSQQEVLCLLTDNAGPLGITIKQLVGSSSIATGRFYKDLRRLEKKGLIEAIRDQSKTFNPHATKQFQTRYYYYRPTKYGRAVRNQIDMSTWRRWQPVPRLFDI